MKGSLDEHLMARLNATRPKRFVDCRFDATGKSKTDLFIKGMYDTPHSQAQGIFVG